VLNTPTVFGISFLALMMTLVMSVSANAITISGTIRNDGDRSPIYIATGSQTSFQADAKSDILALLHRLRTGDQITAQGSISSDGKKLVIDSVDRVGLQELLGAWRSSRWEIFEFRDFTSLNLYVPTVVDEGSASLVRTHSLKYVITPEQNDRYSIFMSDNMNVRMGFLEVTANKLTLTVTDPKTGQVSENISLSPTHLQ
jgi:hypothetical protein